MSNQIQVGDVWHDEEDDIKYTVSKIHGNQVAFWYLENDVLCVYTDYTEHMLKYMTLIERDGKEWPEVQG